MSEYVPFSVRQRYQERQGAPVTYQYEYLPNEFRAQVFHTLDGALGRDPVGDMIQRIRLSTDAQPALDELSPREVWKFISDDVARRAGVFELWPGIRSHREQFKRYFASASQSTEKILDAIEIAFKKVERLDELPSRYYRDKYDLRLPSTKQ